MSVSTGLACPSCRSLIALDDVNVGTDAALCRKCGGSYRYSELAAIGPAGVDPQSPPPGAWYEPLADGFRVGASTRSPLALFLVPFTCVWSGGALFGIYGTQFNSGRFSALNSVFGIPFLLGTCMLVTMCAMATAGRVEVTRHGYELSVFTGVGPLGWTERARWSDFEEVRVTFAAPWGGFKGAATRVIALEGTRFLAFGSGLSEERRYFVAGVLRRMIGSRR